MKNLRTLISESIDVLRAHSNCAEAGVPLPDKELKNLREFHNGWRYDTDNGGFVEHNTTSHGARKAGEGYITHYDKNHKIHRDGNLPAVVHSSGAKIWFKDGQRLATYLPSDDKHGSNQETFYAKEDLGTGQATKLTREEFTKTYKGL